MRKQSFVTVTVLIALLLSAVGVLAEEASDDLPPPMSDGRVNEWDIAASLVIYCEFAYPYSDDPQLAELDYIEFYVQGAEADVWYSALSVPGDSVLNALAEEDAVTIAEQNGVTLIAVDDELTAYGPAGYSFTWSLGDSNC